MSIRETLRERPALGAAVAALLVVLAASAIAYTNWPQRHPDLSQAFYTVDDGQTWFEDSAYRVAPFDYQGKEALIARVYSYADGKKRFCGYVARFRPAAKQKLENALAAAEKSGQPPESVPLYKDWKFMQSGLEVKAPGAGKPWLRYDDPRANEIFAVRSPDGSPVDDVFVGQ